MYLDSFESATFCFRIRLPSTRRSAESGRQIRNFLNPLSRREIFESADVTRSSRVLYREYSRRSEQKKISGVKNIPIRVDVQIRFESGYVWT